MKFFRSSGKTTNNAIEDRRVYMTSTPVRKLIPKLAVPSIISMLVTSLYNIVDTFFVGQISTQATAAVGVVLPLMAIFQAFGFFCGHGSGNYISMKLGSREIREAEIMSANGFFLAFGIGLCISVLGLCFVRPLAGILGATDTIIEDTIRYMSIILLGAPFTTSQFVINNQLRFEGSASYAMVGIASGAVINIVLDPILIFGLGMGVRGAAIATVIGQIISFSVLLYGTSLGPNIRIRFRNLKLNARYLTLIARGGTPSLVRQALNSVSVMIMNLIAGAIAGDAAIAAMSITGRIMMVSFSALIGFGHGFQPVCTFSYGAGLYSRMREARSFCIRYGTIFMTVAAALMFAFAPQLIRFFRNDPEVIAIGTRALRYLVLAFPLGAYTMMNSMLCQAINMSKRATFLSAARSGVCYIPILLVLTHFFELDGLVMSQMWADIGTFLLTIPVAVSVLRELPNEDRNTAS